MKALKIIAVVLAVILVLLLLAVVLIVLAQVLEQGGIISHGTGNLLGVLSLLSLGGFFVVQAKSKKGSGL